MKKNGHDVRAPNCDAKSSFFASTRVRVRVRRGHAYVQDPEEPFSSRATSGERKHAGPRVWVLAAPCGRGKSQLFRRTVRRVFPVGSRVLSITPRVSLAVAQSTLLEGLGFVSYHTMKNVPDELSAADRCICEYESLHHMDPAALNRPYDLVVCDEIRSTLCSAASSATNRTHLVANAFALTRVLSLARNVLLMDADVESDGAVARLVTLVMREPPERVHYEVYPPLSFEPPHSPAVLQHAGRSSRELVLTHDESSFWESIVRSLKGGERVAVVCALRKQALGYADACTSAGLIHPDEVGCYTSDMSERDVNRVFSDFDSATKGKRLVVFTSKVSVGIDASVTRPHRIFMDFHRPVQVARVALQMLYRFRKPMDGSTLCLVPPTPEPRSSGRAGRKSSAASMSTTAAADPPPLGVTDLIQSETGALRGLHDEMRIRARSLAACESSSVSQSSLPPSFANAPHVTPPPPLLQLCIAITRAERQRTFVDDLVRLARDKGLRVRRDLPDEKKDDKGCVETHNLDHCMRTAVARVRGRDKEFASRVTLAVVRASRSREGLQNALDASRRSGSKGVGGEEGGGATRATRAVELGSEAFIRHSSFTSGGGALVSKILGPLGSASWHRLVACGRLRDAARCYVVSEDGRTSRWVRPPPAIPECAGSTRAACEHLYRETLAAHASGRSQRISALIRAACKSNAPGSQGGAQSPQVPRLKQLSNMMQQLVCVDMASRVEYGSACIPRSEMGTFQACHALLERYLGIPGGLCAFTRPGVHDGASAAPVLAAAPVCLDRIVGGEGSASASVRKACVALARKALMLCQNILSSRGYEQASRFDGTFGGPRVQPPGRGERSEHTVAGTLHFASSVLYFVYGIVLVPRESLEAIVKRASPGVWDLGGRELASRDFLRLFQNSAYVAVADHTRWMLAQMFSAADNSR